MKQQLLHMMKSASVHGRNLELEGLKLLYLNEIDLAKRTGAGVRRVLNRIDRIEKLRNNY